MNGGWIMGLKRAAPEDRGAFEREETEVAAPSGEPDLTLFDKAVAREITDLTGAKPLTPQFGSDIRRATRTIEANGAAIEVAFDAGVPVRRRDARAGRGDRARAQVRRCRLRCSTSASRWSKRFLSDSDFRARPSAPMR